MAGIGAAVLGKLADLYGIEYVYRLCAFLPLLGLLTAFLPISGGGLAGSVTEKRDTLQ